MRYMICRYFLPLYGCLSAFLMGSFWLTLLRLRPSKCTAFYWLLVSPLSHFCHLLKFWGSYQSFTSTFQVLWELSELDIAPPAACALCPCTSGLPSADRHLLGPVIPWAFSQKALFPVLNFTIPSPLLLLPSTFHILTRWHSFFGLLWDPRSIFSEFLLPSPAWTSWEVALNWLYQYHSSLIPSSMSPAQNIPPP